jgi:hypothetical protein
MKETNYPNGFSGGLTVRGVPILNSYAGNIFWLDSGIGSDGNRGKSKDKPFATLSYAVSQCTANNGDIIIIAPGHAETISTATALAINVVGVSSVGLGVGALRPTFTVGTIATATITFSAANCSMENCIVKSNLDGLNAAVTVTGAGVYLDIEHQDASSIIEADIAIECTGDQFTCKLRDIGFTAGDQRDQSITLNGVDNARIEIDFFGKVVTAVVNMITAACTDVKVTGTMYVSGTTDGSKNVVDTITGSSWYMDVIDSAAGARYTGGSASAVASDDISTINSKVGTITNTGGTATIGAVLGDFANTTLISKLDVPAADATTNVDVADVAGNKTDTSIYVPGTTKSIAAYSKGTADLQERVTKKAAATMVSAQTMFTVAGGPIEIMALVSVCETANDATASTLQYNITPTTGSATTISAASASLASAAAGASVALAGTALATAALLNAGGPNLMANPGTIFCPIGTINMIIGVGSTTGTWAHYLRYKPLATGVTVS